MIKTIVKQSWLCHPDWDTETHLGYLRWEEMIPAPMLPSEATIAEWIRSFGDHATALDDALGVNG